MIQRVVSRQNLHKNQVGQDRVYWLTRPLTERIDAVELLRKAYYGNSARLQRTVTIRSLKSGTDCR